MDIAEVKRHTMSLSRLDIPKIRKQTVKALRLAGIIQPKVKVIVIDSDMEVKVADRDIYLVIIRK
jgi:DUF1009 family protein